MVSISCFPTFWAGISLIIIALLSILFITTWQRWFSDRKWKFRVSDDKTLWQAYFDHAKKQPRQPLWESEIQKVGMFCEIDLGRIRKVAKVRFSDGGVCKLPLKSHFLLYNDNNDADFLCIEKKNEYPECSDELELKIPFKARYIRMQIVEPEPFGKPQTWRVNAIYVKVKTPVRLKYTIGKTWLDAL